MLSIASSSLSFLPPSSLSTVASSSKAAHIQMKASEFAYGLPGGDNILGEFDPAGFMDGKSKLEVYRLREAELAHGRVAMVGALGFLVQEQFHPLFADVGGPAIRQLDVILQTPNGLSAGTVMLFGIFFSEWSRAKIGWMEPEVEMRTLRPNYLPGDLGFDPLGFKHKV